MMDDDDSILNLFFEEATGILEEVYDTLKNYSDETSSDIQSEQLNAVYRGIHSIKGGASMFELVVLTEVAHELESYLSKAKESPDQFNVTYVTHQVDHIESLLLKEVNKNQVVPPVITNEEPHKIEQSSHQKEAPEPPKERTQKQQETPPIKKEIPNLIRVPLDRIQRSYDITSEIFLLRNQIAHLLEIGFRNNEIESDLFLKWEILDNSLRQHIVELESAVLSMRMTTVKSLFDRMEKTIRTYNESSEKNIQVQMIGQSTEVDKRILDSLGEPLIHIIRNAMDHGIELPKDRNKKSQYGTITMEAKIIGNEAVFKISDDGKGINTEQILESAKTKGLDVSNITTDQDILQLIFAPGFSTASEVSEISGRGVGMDVVKTYVEKSGGSIHVETKVGEGTTFSLNLPIGLSIIPLIVISVGEHFYGIPTHDIRQTYTIQRSEIVQNRGDHLLNIDDQFIKCIFLADHFDNTHAKDIIMRRNVFVCLANIHGESYAFIADKLIANTELIVKALPPGVPALPYLQGVSILTTGTTAFILSLEKLYKNILIKKGGKLHVSQ